jgi:hypothetical protein
MFRAIPKSILSVLAAAALAIASAAYAQQKDFKPHVGQLNMAQTKPEDYVIDLGAGDGKIAIAAAKKFGARSLGIEYNPDMAALAQRNAQAAGVQGKAQIVQGDIFVTDFTQATVLTMYLLPSLNMKLRPQILAMRPGTRVVTHAFNMEDWEADESSDVDGRRAYLWIVPANVSGRWAMELSGAGSSERLSLNFDQKYQKIEGVAYLGSILAGLREPRLSGFRISFSSVDNHGVRRDFAGRVTGSAMEGSFRADGGQEGRWTATKK